MAEHYYKSLPDIAQWDRTIKDVGPQIRPYEEYLKTAIKSAEQRRPVLKWRKASEEEIEEFESRRDERRKTRNNGHWIVLEPIPERLDEPEQTFDTFLDSDEVFEDEEARSPIKKIDADQEGRALFFIPFS